MAKRIVGWRKPGGFNDNNYYPRRGKPVVANKSIQKKPCIVLALIAQIL